MKTFITYIATAVFALCCSSAVNAQLAKPMFDFDGDKKTDFSFYRPTTAEWHILHSQEWVRKITRFLLPTIQIVPADYDGDGITDIATISDDRAWYVLQSTTKTTVALPVFGLVTDFPLPADFDGDGRADQAVFRPATNSNPQAYFFYRGTLNNPEGHITFIPFGQTSDMPVLGDYDGDRRIDPTIFRPSVGEWWYLRSSDGANRAFQFGQNGDKPVSGDFTGDGKTDIAIFRPSTGAWFILRSEDYSYYAGPFGQMGDIPVVGDYGGDGRDDLAVWRPSEGNWYVLESSSGIFGNHFGSQRDKPIPAVYVPNEEGVILFEK